MLHYDLKGVTIIKQLSWLGSRVDIVFQCLISVCLCIGLLPNNGFCLAVYVLARDHLNIETGDYNLHISTLTHGCLKVHGGGPIVLCIFVEPL